MQANPRKRKAAAGDLQDELPKAAKLEEDDDAMPQAPQKPVLREAQPSEFKHACPATTALVTVAYDATKLPKDLLLIVAAMADADHSFVIREMSQTQRNFLAPGVRYGIENSVTGVFDSHMPVDSGEKDVLCLHNATGTTVKLDVRRGSSPANAVQLVDIEAGAFARLYPLHSFRDRPEYWYARQHRVATSDFQPIYVYEDDSVYAELEMARHTFAEAKKELERLEALDPVRPPFYVDRHIAYDP